MKKFLSNLKGKRIIAAYVLLAIFGVNQFANAAAVTMETKLLSQNATTNAYGNYTSSVTASDKQLVRIEAWYHNTMNQDSGLNANNVVVKIALPNNVGKTHTATSTISGGNTNTVTGSTTINTPNNSKLEYVPGYAFRRYNKGTNVNQNWVTEKISDVVISGGYVIVQMKPCWNFAESITIVTRVVDQATAPTCTISATPNSIERGNSAVLNFSSTNATSASISGIGSVATSGNRTVSPTADTTYNMTVTGAGGTANCRTTVRVTEKVIPTPTPEPPAPTPTPTTVVKTVPGTNFVSVTGKDAMPTSGPAEAAAGAVGLTSIGGAALSWAMSKKALLSAIKKIK